MNFSAIDHKPYDNYCYPINENELVIKIKTGYDIDNVELMYGDPFKGGMFGGSDGWHGELAECVEIKKLQYNKVWKFIVKPEFKRCRYYFVLHCKDEKYYMCEDVFRNEQEFKSYKGRRQDFFFPWMNSSDIIKPSKWVNETVWYQIFPDRFCNSGTERPFKYKKWSKPDQKVTNAELYGGDIKGIISKLDYIKDLGVTGIYFTPLNESPSNHKYNTTNYKKVDPNFGSNEDLKNLVKEAHKRGIRIMLDGVFNHSGTEFEPWKDVLKNGKDSKYFNWFMINKLPIEQGKFNSNAKKGIYYTFAFEDYMPKLNTNNQEVIDYLIDVCKFWVNEFDIDALRLDVANEISHNFNKQLRKAMFSLKPDFYICGEVWHNSMPWLRGDEFDAIMNYSLQESVDSFWANEETTAEDFEHNINNCFNMYPEQVNTVLFNLLDSHDTMRLINRCKGNENKFYQMLSVLFTMNGTTCIYYGTELILPGGYDPDCRRCMPWDNIENGEYNKNIENIKSLISMRKKYDILRQGELRFLDINSGRVIAYEKFKGDNVIRVILNCSENDIEIGNEYKEIVFARNLSNNCLGKDGVAVMVM